jgi:hypothetical protein
MGGFGAEFKNFQDEIPGRDRRDQLRSIGTFLRGIVASSDMPGSQLPKILYFAPGRYQVGREAGNLFEFPEGMELRFAPGAFLAPVAGVTLVIRGSIRAPRLQIFGGAVRGDNRGAVLGTEFPHLPNREILVNRRREILPGPDSGPRRDELLAYLRSQNGPLGLVRIESEEISDIYPEWWGAVHNESDTDTDSSDALQACFHAACRDRTREGRLLPALRVVMSGPYRTWRKLVAEAPPGLPGHLWLSGTDSISHGGLGNATITRQLSSQLLDLDLLDTQCALEIGPRVSLVAEGVSFNSLWLNAPPKDQIASSVSILRARGDAERWVLFDRCGLGGGRDSAVRVPDPLAEGSGADVSPDAEPDRVRVGLQQCTLNAWRADVVEETSKGLVPLAFRVRRPLSLQLRSRDVVALSACFLRGSAFTRAFPGARLPTPGELTFEAGIHVRGGALYVRGTKFHFADGPRPIRPAPPTGRPDLPDGQDIWLDSGAEGLDSTQLTMMQCETQSWWCLGGKPVERNASRAAAVLLSLSGGNVNWKDETTGPILARLRGVPVDRILYDDNAADDPPVVAWPGGDGFLVTVGCVFGRYVTLAEDSQVFDVGSMFFFTHPALQTVPRWLPPRFIPRPPRYPRVVATDLNLEVRVRGLPLQRVSEGT